jgi:coenzyme F420-reducing hydrogenase alpha subunit
MSGKIILQKATRIEGNANVAIDVENGRVKSARFLVYDFRGFEKFLQGQRLEQIPSLVSRICGLCSVAHQVAGCEAIEDALEIRVPRSVRRLREIMVLAEWISSHSLSYFFLTLPDFVGARGGFFELMASQPEVAREAYDIRKAGQRIIQLVGKRATHPVSLGIGGFLMAPTAAELAEIQTIAAELKKQTARLIIQASRYDPPKAEISFPPDQQLNLLTCDAWSEDRRFQVFDRQGALQASFKADEFSDNVSEMRAEWSFAKFPYLTSFGFPQGILLVGPLARTFQAGGPLEDQELRAFPLAQRLADPASLTLESFDHCRLLEIFWAARRILTRLEGITQADLKTRLTPADYEGSGQGIGVLEAPRGTLMHKFIVNHGCLERARLLVATQFNNAYINLLIHDLAEKHLDGDKLSQPGEWLIGRCIRLFDPCLSCATH